MTDTLVILGTIRRYSDLHELMRVRADELELTRLSIDRLARLQPGYASKLLSPRPMRRLTDETLGFVMPALAMKLVAVEDTEMLEHVKNRGERRLLPSVLGTTMHFQMSRRELKRRQRAGGRKRKENLSPKRRSAIARKAAKARWHKPKIVRARVRDTAPAAAPPTPAPAPPQPRFADTAAGKARARGR